MAAPSETLLLSGSFGESKHPALENPGQDVLFSDKSALLQAKGDWRPEELRTVHSQLGTLALYGNCLADEGEIDKALSEALEGGNPKVLATLPGSYTAMLFGRDRLTVFADLANQFPFYYQQSGQEVRFGSSAKPLQGSAGMYAPDAVTLAADMAVCMPADLVAGRSALAGVRQLEAGHVLEVTRQGSLRTSPYETFQTPPLSSIDEAADVLRAALQDAVRRRAVLGYRMSADFSGGLDSTSAAYLLAGELKEPLLVATRYSGDVPSDDLACARRYLALPESQGLFNAQEFEWPAAMTAYADLWAVQAGDVPDQSILTHTRDRAYYEFLRERGSELHITGSGADTLLDMDPRLYLGGLARPGTYGRFVRSVFEAARVGLKSPLSVLNDLRTQRHIDPATKLRLMSRILQGDRSPELLQYGRGQIFGAGAMPEWLTKQARRELSDLALARADEIWFVPGYDSGNYHAYAELKSLGTNTHSAMQYAARFGLRKHAVYMDNDVLRACFSLPAHLRVNPWTFKELLVRAVDGLVPGEVTSRPTKGDYSLHGIQGLRAARDTIRHLLRDSRLAGLGVVDPGAIQRSLDSIEMGANPPWTALDRFIATELWLRSLENGHPGKNSSKQQPENRPAIAVKTLEPPLSGDSRYGMPSGVFMVTRPTGAVAVNIPQATYHRLNKDAFQVLEALQNAANFSEALSVLETVYPAVDRSKLQTAASRLVRQLSAEGILAEGLSTFSIVAGSQNSGGQSSVAMTRQASEVATPRLRDYPAAVGGAIVALSMRRMPFARQARVLEALHKRWTRRPAAEAEAVSLLAAVQRVSGPYLGRVACLEACMATVLAAALRGRTINLVLGVKTDPDRPHAWPEVGGVPIRTARDPEVQGIFEPIFKV